MCRSLRTLTAYNALRYAQPPGGIRRYRFPVSIWKHLEGLSRLPRGILPIADALCRFKPIYGKGMSPPRSRATWRRMYWTGRLRTPVLDTPWTMSTSTALAFPGTRGERPDNSAQAQQ
jgi:hypothetical protein